MKAKINGVEVEGTADEFKQFLGITKPHAPLNQIKRETNLDKNDYVVICSNGTKRKYWCKEELDKLIELNRANLSVEDIANKMGRTHSSVYVKLQRLKNKPKSTKSKVWSITEKMVLVKDRHAGASWGEIARRLNRSVNSARSQYHALRKNHPELIKEYSSGVTQR